jgi:hypothetical protein
VSRYRGRGVPIPVSVWSSVSIPAGGEVRSGPSLMAVSQYRSRSIPLDTDPTGIRYPSPRGDTRYRGAGDTGAPCREPRRLRASTSNARGPSEGRRPNETQPEVPIGGVAYAG